MEKLLGPASRLIIPGVATYHRDGDRDRWYVEKHRREGGLLVRRDEPIIPDLRMEGWVDGEEVDILENWFAGTALPNTPSHIGLFTTTPADDGTGSVEATGGSYARVAVARNGTNWGSAAGGAPSTIENLLQISFTQATANWGTIASWGYFTAITAGTLLFFAVLDASKAIDNGDTASFAAGDLTAQLGDPSDTY